MNETAPAPPPANDSGPAVRYANEPLELRYARHARNATVFIAWCVGAFIVLALIAVIVAAIQDGNVSSQWNQIDNGGRSNCLSQGGSNPNC
jgi:hypothetical protein